MKMNPLAKHSVEILEQRIAPAGLIESGFKTAAVGTPLRLDAGQGLSTGGAGGGVYMLYVEKGSALVFTTDFNNNNAIDFNEVTGIAAGDGLRLISFVDIYGDIVTNLRPDGRLSDSGPGIDNPDLGGDGLVLLNSTIEKIELRSLTVADIGDQDDDQDVDDADLAVRLALSSYSIHGNVLAGKGFGVANDATSGLIIDDTGRALQQTLFVGPTGGTSTVDYFIDFKPMIGSIKTGTAATGTFFSFGVSTNDDIAGRIVPFNPNVGQVGGDIYNVRTADPAMTFNLDSLEAGDGGIGARGGDIGNVTLNGDTAGGYRIIAGDGGRGVNGGAGGSIIALSDLGSITGSVLLKTGDGGQASTGTGGNGGNLSFGTVNVKGGITIVLGDGGDGFVAGGNGASFTNGTFTTPEGGVPVGLSVVAQAVDRPISNVTHLPLGTVASSDVFGTSIPIDFNENLLGDFVFTSANASQVGVVLDGGGFFGTGVIYLDGPTNADSVVVGDFNDDGNQDIAVASNDAGDFAGIYVFLSKFEDLNGDGVLSDSEDLNNNGVDDFLGFYGAIRSNLPALTDFAFNRSATAIGDLAAGDFDNDGDTDLAVVATYTGRVQQGPGPFQVVLFLNSDVEDGKLTGEFFADFAAGTPVADLYTSRGTGSVLIEATSLTAAGGGDILFVARKGNKDQHFALSHLAGGVTTLGSYNLGKVDTDRLDVAGNDPHRNMVDATLRDFMLADINNDGNVDFVALTEQPSPDFIVAIAGTPTGAPGLYLSDATTAQQDQNAGIALSKGDGTRLGRGSPMMDIQITDADGDGIKDDIAVLNFDGDPNTHSVEPLVFAPRTTVTSVGVTAGPANIGTTARDESVVAFDSYMRDLAQPAGITYLVANPTVDERGTHGIIQLAVPPPTPATPTLIVVYADDGVRLFSGNGGDALVGHGGSGGDIGGGIKIATDPLTGTQTVQGALNITFPDNLSFRPLTVFTAGRGGNGFTTGGAGGDISGVVLRRPGVIDGFGVSLFAGDGGFGVSGAGGAGGDLRGNSIQGGDTMSAGDGGRGKTGGAGGSIIGNGLKNIYDTRVVSLQAVAGQGGLGIKAGGAGGSVTNFHAAFSFDFGEPGGLLLDFLDLAGGDGGTSVSGTGGAGGAVVNSGTLPGVNTLTGPISLRGGAGGAGVNGGAGGAVTNFTNHPSTADLPAGLNVAGGFGGAGVAGKGGVGGAATGIDAPSRSGSVFAGSGGNSSGGAGGVGGAVSGLNVSATSGLMAIASGSGGAGLSAGGAGGNVSSVVASVGGNAGGNFSKLVVVAGAGGDASAFIPNLPNDASPNQAQKAFGGKVGVGGAGGNITGVTQEGGVSTRVDLISGNGGSTINYGTIAPSEKTFVGKGGSISNIKVEGTIGTLDAAVPLEDFNGSNFNTVNVGIIVGTAGRLKTILVSETPAGPIFTSQPAAKGINGSLSSVTAGALASAVAGSIDRIAAITKISGLNISGIIGADKDPVGSFDYLDKEGNPVTAPVLDGSLIDGAIVAKEIVGNLVGRVYILT